MSNAGNIGEVHIEMVEFRADAMIPGEPLRGMATLAAPGVYDVLTWDGKRFVEYVPPSTLSDPAYVASLAGLPVTLEHPPLNPPLVTPANFKRFAVGGLGTPTVRADGVLQAATTIYDAIAQQAALTTHKQISLAYLPLYDLTPGVTPDGKPYDRKQIKRTQANHAALERVGVHGQRAEFRADSADSADAPRFNVRADSAGDITNHGNRADSAAPFAKSPTGAQPNAGVKMATVKLGNATVEVADNATALAIQAHVDGIGSQLTAALTHTVRADRAEAERDAAKAEIATVKAAKETEIAAIRADAANTVRARIVLETRASDILGAEYKHDGKSDREIRADACKALGREIPADKSDAYVEAAFEMVLESRADGARDHVAPAVKVSVGQAFADRMNSGARADAASDIPEFDRNRAMARKYA